MIEFQEFIQDTDDCEAILEHTYATLTELGVRWFSYHFTPIFEPQTSHKAFVWAKGYPLEVQKLYIGDDLRACDPFPALVFEHGPAMTWNEVRALAPDTPENREYFALMEQHDGNDGACFALYGPRNRNAYANLGFALPTDTYGDGHVALLHSYLQATHLRLCKIIDEKEPSLSLSERELEVLQWVGRGKSGTDIAAILDISPETVKTYTRRIYDKLETNDRVTAVVRGLQLGVLTL